MHGDLAQDDPGLGLGHARVGFHGHQHGVELGRVAAARPQQVVVGAGQVDRLDDAGLAAEPPLQRLPIGARLEATGTANTDTGGYHETVTAYHVGAVHALVDRSLDELVAHPVCSRAAPLSHWSRERLFSVAARRRWVPPDLAPLPWWTPGPAGTSGAVHGAPAEQPLG